MRIAHVNPDPGLAPGKQKGACVHVAALRAAFAALGAEVHAIDGAGEREVREALAALEQDGPLDLVYERHALGRYAAGEHARERGVPHVLEVNAPLEDEEQRFRGPALAGLDPARQRACFAGAALVLCVSSAVAAYGRARGARRGHVAVVPNAVDPQLFRPRADGDALRAELVPQGRIALGFHGRLRPWHRFEALVAAAGTLLERGVELQLVLLGEGDFGAHWHGRLPQARVTHRPWAEHAQAARIVACFDLLPLCYAPGEPCYFSPLKLLEGMAVGAVPVVPALGDLPRSVRHGRDGLLYPPGEQAAFVAALERLCREPALRQRLGRAARARAEAHTWTDVARGVLARVQREELRRA
jgi:glycosyltransferase involved in cell wall biosynthesis